jgi:hypothetical protein
MIPKGSRLHGYECYRDVYFKIGSPEVLARFGATDIVELFNGVYTKTVKEGGEIFLATEEMKKEGYFYIPPRTIQGEITVARDFNLIDQFEITLLADFLQTKSLKILEMSTGNEALNFSITGSNIKNIQDFSRRSTPYYPMMDTILLGNLFVKAELGYVENTEHSITVQGMCVGITPTFRKDGYPIVKLTFRDVGWAMGKHVMSTTYPVLNKDRGIQDIVIAGDIQQ